jgi:hypothetical protein
MSNNNNERRELTAAELDLVTGGVNLQECMISGYAVSGGAYRPSITMLDYELNPIVTYS